MRRTHLIFFLSIFVFVALMVRSVFTLLTLLVEDASEDSIARAELPAPNSPLIDTRPQYIPKIIHQTYINETIPERWREAQKSCQDIHSDYEYKVRRRSAALHHYLRGPSVLRRKLILSYVQQLWTDVKSRDFIAAEYPWFLDTFDGYSYPIQRADAIRYFVLSHFGGIYIDLDDVCLPMKSCGQDVWAGQLTWF